MVLSLLIAAGIVLSGAVVTWMGVELTFFPPQSAEGRRKVRIALGISFSILLAFTLWATLRGERAMADLPKQIGDYMRSITAPPSVAAPPPVRPLAQPKLRLWIRSSTKTGMHTLEWTPGMGSSILVGYGRNVSPAIPNAHTVDIYFFVRDVGATPVANLVIHPQIPPSITLKCIECPNLGLIGVAPDECNPPIEPLPTIFPAPKKSGTPDLSHGRSSPELYLRMRLIVPDSTSRFDIDLQLVADSVLPTLYRAQFVPMMEAP